MKTRRMADADELNQVRHLCEKDSASPSHKRSKPNGESSNELFAVETGLENIRVTQSCVFSATQDEAPGDSYDTRCLSLSQSACGERETHVESVIKESAAFFGLNSGYTETNCTVEECQSRNHKLPSPGLFVMVREQKQRLSPQATPQSSHHESPNERGMPFQCVHQNNIGGTLEANYILNCIKYDTPSADMLAPQRNSLEYVPMPYMSSDEAECAMNSTETFVKIGENEYKNEGKKPRLKVDAKEDAEICDAETNARDESSASEVAQYADSSFANDVKSSGRWENDGSEIRGDLRPGFLGGEARACAERATGAGPGSVSLGPPDVIDVAAASESHICHEADGTGAEQTERAASGCRASDGISAAPGARSDGPVRRSSRDERAAGFQEGREEVYKERLSKGCDEIPEESVRLAPSSGEVPLIDRIYELEALPLAEASAHIDSEFTNSPERYATMEPADPRKEFTWETGTGKGQLGFNVSIHPSPEPTERQCRAREELGGHGHESLRHVERHRVNSLCATMSENYSAKSQSQVSKSDTAHYRCEVNNLESAAPSNTDCHIRTVGGVSPTCEHTVVNVQAEERDSGVTVMKLLVGSVKVESEVEGRGSSAAAGWGDSAAESNICEGERGPPASLPPQAMLTNGCVRDDVSLKHQSDAKQTLVEERPVAAPVEQPGDAVVPGTDTGYEANMLQVCLETKAQFPALFRSDCSPAVFDSFEKVPLSPSVAELDHSPLFNDPPRSPIRGRPQSYYDADGPSIEPVPMQMPHLPNSGLSRNNELLAESECGVEHSPSRKGRASNCSSRVVKSGPGGSDRGSPSAYLCGLREEKQIPAVHFSPGLPAEDPEQSDQLPAAFAASAQSCLLPESIPDVSDQHGRLRRCPQPGHLRPQTSVLTSDCPQNDSTPRFEMRERFDLVLEELSLFFGIGRGAEEPASSETLCATGVPPEDVATERDVGHLSDPPLKAQGRTKAKQNVHCDTRAVKVQAEPTSSSVGFDYEQEVPLGLSHSSAEGEDSMYSAVKQKERIVTEDGSKHWFPAFMVLPFPNEQDRGFLEPSRRLEPLKTCVRPIRVGLSKRERPKQLHPYLK